MAVTNRAKGQEKPPAWAVRGKLRLAHVYGGPSETARAILTKSWDHTPGALLTAAMYGPELVAELVARKFNAVCLTWSPGFSHEGDQPQWEIVGKLLPLLKKKKIRAIANITLARCFPDEMLDRAPFANDWVLRRDSGEPLASEECKACDEPPHCLQMNILNSGWRDYLSFKVTSALDAGFNGLYFTDVLGQASAATGLLALLRDVVKSHAPEKSADLLFYANSYGFLELTEPGNFIHSEAAECPGLVADGKLVENVGLYKFLFEAGGREKPFSQRVPEIGEIRADGKTLSLATAEILALGGLCHDFDVPVHYQSFQAENPALFGSMDPINTVGILFNDEPQFDAHISFDIATFFARRNIQFDMIPARSIEDFDIRKYKLLFIETLPAISDGVAEILAGFVRDHGGTLLASPSTGMFDDKGRDREPPDFLNFDEPLSLRNEKVDGRGRVILYAPASITGPIPLKVLEEINELLVGDIIGHGGERPIEVEAPDGLIAFLWGKGTRRWVHVVNYRVETCDASITLPGCGGRKLAVHSPDAAVPELTVIDTGSARAQFTLKGVETYAIVEVI